MLRTAQKRNKFTPDNNPDKGEWYWADVDAMATQAGGAEAGVQPVFVEEVFGASIIGCIEYVLLTGYRGPCWGSFLAISSRRTHWKITIGRCAQLARFVHSHLVRSHKSARFVGPNIVDRYSLSAFTTVMFLRLVLKRRQALARIPR